MFSQWCAWQGGVAEQSVTTTEAKRMNQDIIAGNWKQLKGKIQAKWGDLAGTRTVPARK
jgi:hypothetical protein